jgi:uncharacterized membrane protein
MKALAWSLVSVTFMSLALTACGSKDDDKEEAAPTSTYTYEANTQKIINDNCATGGCHNAASPNNHLTTLQEVKDNATEMAKRIKATDGSVMPQGKPTWKNTDEAKILLDWLAGGADLK